MTDNCIIFYITSVMAILFALSSLFVRNIIYSLLLAVGAFLCGAIIFFMLGSEYNAIIQASVYGFAVPILIGISIMFITTKNEILKDRTFPYIVILFAGLFSLAFIHLIGRSLTFSCDIFNTIETPQRSFYDVISAFAQGIFINYVWAFELVSLLLLVVIAGITILRKRGL